MKFLIKQIFFFFLGTAAFCSQTTNSQKNLLKKAENNFLLAQKDPHQSFIATGPILREARKINAKEAELRALLTQGFYYKSINDFKNMKVCSELLLKRANEFSMQVYQIIARTYLADVYMYNNLQKDAFSQLQKGSEVIENLNSSDSLTIVTTSNHLIAYSDYYLINREYDLVIKYVKKSIAENDKFSNHEVRRKLGHVEYANLASAYMNLNYDSARYYAQLSLALDRNYERNDVKTLDYGMLGEISKYENDYASALDYYKKAENLKGHANHLTLANLYEQIIDLYDKQKDYENLKKYQAKRDSLKLLISENKINSLHDLLKDKEIRNYNTQYLVVGLVILLMLIFIVLYRKGNIFKKNKIIKQDQSGSHSVTPSSEPYSKLMKMFESNDPAFIPYFDTVVPDFSAKLLSINPGLLSSDIEFCALLKLKIPTHDIARYKNITIKSVQNKKYVIRKKLSIAPGIDIYNYFYDL